MTPILKLPPASMRSAVPSVISVLPPPMSITTGGPLRDVDRVGRREVDQACLLRARRSPARADPSSRRTVATNSAPFSASRTALVAAATISSTPWDAAMRMNFDKRVHRRRHAAVRQTPAVEAAHAETDHVLLAIDDLEGQIRAHPAHDHVQRVGADVDGGDAHDSERTREGGRLMRHATTPSHVALARVVGAQQACLEAAWPGALQGDPQALRHVRIAGRRLRILLGLVRRAGVDAPTRALGRDLGRIGRALGPVRELAVAREELDRAADRHAWPPDRLQPIWRHLDQAQHRACVRMHAQLKAVDLDTHRVRLARLGAAIAASADDRRWRAALAVLVARRAVRLQDRFAACGMLYEPERLHARRIAIKKLRYALELAAAATDLRVGRLLRALKLQQRRYGTWHDRQVLFAEVQTAAAGRRAIDAARLAPVADRIERDCRARHAAAHAASDRLATAAADAARVAAVLARSGRTVIARAGLTDGSMGVAPAPAAGRRRAAR